MSGVLCSVIGASFAEARPAIGDAYEGGYFAGQFKIGGTTYDLIISPKSSGHSSGFPQWKTSETTTAGTTSPIDGASNTAAMISAGASQHPAASFCNNLSIGGYTDWYMPSLYELEIIYYNLKPGTGSNTTSYGTNPYSVPSRNTNYTTSNPSQTSVGRFRSGGADAQFDAASYWASTEASVTDAHRVSFSDGNQSLIGTAKDNGKYTRAVRKVAVA